jgi:hypothetical protein
MLVYCDYIADKVVKTLRTDSYSEDSLLHFVSHAQLDLDEQGIFQSTKKVVDVQDKNGVRYRVTVEEVDK